MKPFFFVVILFASLTGSAQIPPLMANLPKSNLDLATELRNVKSYSVNTSAFLSDAVTAESDNKGDFPPVLIPKCNPIPTQTEINNANWYYEEHMYSLSEALSLKIPVVNVSGSTNLKIYTKDYKRLSNPCDGGTGDKCYYGQIIRTTIEIENYDASLGFSLAAFAANATLSKATQHFYFYKSGFYNPLIDSIISSVSGKDFNVENYYLFQQTLPAIQNLLKDPRTTFSPTIINVDYESSAEKMKLNNAPILSYAIQNIVKQNSFNSAISKYRSDNNAISLITSVYSYFGIPKDNSQPSKLQSLTAEPYLNGVTIKW